MQCLTGTTRAVTTAMSVPHQRDDGTLGGELRGAEQRPDEAVDEFVFRIRP